MLFFKRDTTKTDALPELDVRRVGLAGGILVVLVIAAFCAWMIEWSEAATFFLNAFGFGISGVFGVILGENGVR
jgi:hypothetical protein